MPISRELQILAGLTGGALALILVAQTQGPALAQSLRTLLAHIDLTADAADQGAPEMSALRGAAGLVAWIAGPVAIAGALGGTIATLGQTRLLLTTTVLRPQLSRINPLGGLRRLVGPANLAELFKSLAKLVLGMLVLWRGFVHAANLLPHAALWSLQTLLAESLRAIRELLILALATQGIIAMADFIWVRFSHGRQLRMSREDIKTERRETDGDPRIKARLARLRMQRGRKRMLAAVPTATVVLTNPTHYAVALFYDRGRNAAPRVVAKGVDSMAARIRDVARDSRVPVVANPPLARALYLVALDAEIPQEHYQATAEIIAYVWRMAARAREAVR